MQHTVDTMLQVWRGYTVRGIQWDATNYIDDLMAMAQGTFEGAIELSLRLLTEYIVLGFSVNLNEKSQIIPTRYYCHIGVIINSMKMRFSLPSRRVNKIVSCLEQLAAAAKIGAKVDAKLVARFIGQLWAANIVCFRAVAIMARAMIATIASMIRMAGLHDITDLNKLRYILKRVWGGRCCGRERRIWNCYFGCE